MILKRQHSSTATGFALASLVMAPLLIFSMVVGLNSFLIEDNSADQRAVSQFATTPRKPKPQIQKLVKPKPEKPKPRQNLKPDLSSMLAGSSFGIKSFEWLGRDSLGGDILDEMKDAAMTADTVEKIPVVLGTAPLDYPSQARKQGIKGYVTLNLLVAPNGSVEKTQIINSQPEGVFDSVAVNSVRQWRFTPGMNKGQRVAVWVEQTIKFALN